MAAAFAGAGDGLFEEGGDAAQLVEDAAAGRLGGVCGEDGSDVEVPDRLAQVFGVGVLEHVGGPGEQPALGGPVGAQLLAAVHLFGDVGQVEVGGEGPYELGGGLQVGVAEQCGGGFAVGARQGAHLFDEVEEVLAFLADEGLAEEVAEAADVRPQLCVGGDGGGLGLGRGGGGLVSTAHRCGSLQCSSATGRWAPGCAGVYVPEFLPQPRLGGGPGGVPHLMRSSAARADRAVRRHQDRCHRLAAR